MKFFSWLDKCYKCSTLIEKCLNCDRALNACTKCEGYLLPFDSQSDKVYDHCVECNLNSQIKITSQEGGKTIKLKKKENNFFFHL